MAHTKPPKKERPLTLKQRRFIAELPKNKFNLTQTALKVYEGNYNSAGSIGTENLQKPAIRREVEKMLQGVEDIGKVIIRQGLRAKKQTAYEGEVFESQFPDYSERRKMLSLVADLAGWKAPKQIEKKSVRLTAKYEQLDEKQLQIALNNELQKLGLKSKIKSITAHS